MCCPAQACEAKTREDLFEAWVAPLRRASAQKAEVSQQAQEAAYRCCSCPPAASHLSLVSESCSIALL